MRPEVAAQLVLELPLTLHCISSTLPHFQFQLHFSRRNCKTATVQPPSQPDERDLQSVIQELRRLGADSATVEVKSASGGLPRSILETVSAFANGSGGLIILGLSESDNFHPAPGFDASTIQGSLARACAEDLEPPLRSEIEVTHFEDATVVVLEVPALDPVERPCHLRARGAYAGSYIRGGDGDRRLTHYEVTQMLSNRRQPVDDAEVVHEANLDDLDPQQVEAFLRRLRAQPTRAFRNVTDEIALQRVGAVARDQAGELRPTLAGLLCLGLYPQQFRPQLFISFVALPGATLGDAAEDGTRFLDNVTCDGSIPQIIETTLAAARRNMRTAAVVRGAGRQDRHDYPIEVIRELVVNAVLHRDYSPQAQGTQVQVELYPDRLVVKSPGGIYGSIDPSQLGVEAVSSTRNAVLAKLLADTPGADGLPVSENRGSGLPRVLTELRKAGMSAPSFEVAPGHVHVRVPQHALLDPETVRWIASLGADGLSDTQHLALGLMRASGSVTNEMLRAWGIEAAAATQALRDLVGRGLAVKLGGRRYATYELLDHPDQPSLQLDIPASTPSKPGRRSRRIAEELHAVVEAVRDGHTTTAAIADRLDLTYPTANRRVNHLLATGRLEESQAPGTRARTLRVPG